MTTPVIRLATSADSDAILGIYAPYIDTSITFEEEAPTREAFQARTDGVLAAHPYLVAELDGKVVGYAYAHELRERGAYPVSYTHLMISMSSYSDRSSLRSIYASFSYMSKMTMRAGATVHN